MQFNDYQSIHNLMVKLGQRVTDSAATPEKTAARKTIAKMSSAEFRRNMMRRPKDDFEQRWMSWILAEETWVRDERPFYNVWPVAVDLARSVRLDLPFSALVMPFESMLLRFARGYEQHGIPFALMYWLKNGEKGSVRIHAPVVEGTNLLTCQYYFEPGQQVQEWLQKALEDSSENASLAETMIRLCVFISLLANDNDFVTPMVLSKDQAKYEATDDAEAKKWLEDRAARRMGGRGFDVGKRLQLAKDMSPHWRNPHLCLFWTGEGRTKPVIKMRSGAIVQSVSMAEVPTGYLGPETPEDDKMPDPKTPRKSFSASRRFEIMKRDGFRCQLCGASQEQGVVLHVDHKVALAKGGSNLDENLWTLCETCNLGKSDKPH